jgi:hypothetical protein
MLSDAAAPAGRDPREGGIESASEEANVAEGGKPERSNLTSLGPSTDCQGS